MRILIWIIWLGAAAQAAEYRIDGKNLYLSGDILVNDELVLETILKDNPQIESVDLKSRGGDLYTAMQLARKLRRYKLETRVDEYCYSACVVAFIGGSSRALGDGEIGFHRVVDIETGKAIALDDPLYNRLTIFGWSKGVDPIKFIQWMSFSEPDDVYIPARDELCYAHVLTEDCGE